MARARDGLAQSSKLASTVDDTSERADVLADESPDDVDTRPGHSDIFEAATPLYRAPPKDEVTRGAARDDDADATRLGEAAGDLTQANQEADQTLPRGSMLGRYVVLERLGAGGMGIVYLAYDPELDRRVALKLIRTVDDEFSESERTLTQTLRSRLLREAQSLAKLSHPNVVTVHDVGVVDGSVFIAMSYLEGQTLRSWARSEARSWKQIIPIAAAAGRGLAAAHAAGLIHRDFKPDNVIIDASGRAYVLDFGLAGADEPPPTHESGSDAGPPSFSPSSFTSEPPSSAGVDIVSTATRSKVLSNAELTEAGSILGTPAYMAPEQYAGRADARSDQFAFCVSLFEVLFGRRPFTLEKASRRVQIERGIRWRSEDRRVPARLRRALERGMDPRPQRRFVSMHELLAVLERDPWQRRRRLMGAAVAAVSMAGAAWSYHRAAEAPLRSCLEGASAMSDLWNAERNDTIAAAFAGLAVPHAQAAWRTSAARIDTYASEWTAMLTDSCTDTYQRAAQSSELFDLRAACLTQRSQRLGALLDVLEQPDKRSADSVVDAVYKLSDVAYCGDSDALLADVPPPEDPEVRANVEAIEAELDEIHALGVTHRFAETLPRTQALLERAKKIDYPPLRARLHGVVTDMLIHKGDLSTVDDHIAEATYEAVRSGSSRLAARAQVAAVWSEGYVRRDFDAAEHRLRMAEAFFEAAGNPTDDIASLYSLKGLIAATRGDRDAGRTWQEKALALQREHLPKDDPRVTITLLNLGLTIADPSIEGTEKAIELYREGIATSERIWGSRHPNIAHTIGNIGTAWAQAGRYEDARGELERSIAMWNDIEQINSPAALSGVGTLASLELAVGRPAAALEVLGIDGEGLPARQIEPCSSPRFHVPTLALVARAYVELGRLDAADEIAKRSLAQCAERLGDAHSDLALLYRTVAEVALAAGDMEAVLRNLDKASGNNSTTSVPEFFADYRIALLRARVHLHRRAFEPARTTLETALSQARELASPEHPEFSAGHRWLGHAFSGLGEHDKARAAFDRSISLLEGAVGQESPKLVPTLLDAAQQALDTNDLAQARARLEQARSSYVEGESDPALSERAARIGAALAEVSH